MGQSIHDVLLALGAKAVRDASSKENVLALDLELLEVRSVFGGALKGEAMVAVSSPEAFAFQRPKELAQCGTLWLPGVETVEAVSQAIVDAHDTLRARLEDDQQSLRKLGLKPKLVAPDPRARAVVDVDGQEARVAIDANGDLVLETIAGQRVPSEHGRVFAPEDVTEDEAMERLEEHIKKLTARGVLGGDADDEESALFDPGVGRANPGDAFDVDVDVGGDVWDDEDFSATASVPVPPHETQATRPLSEEQLAELEAALSEDSEGLGDDVAVPDQNELIDASDEAEPLTAGDDDMTAHGIEVDAIHPRFARDADDEPKTISIQARKPSSLLAALDNEERAAADELPSVGAVPDDDDGSEEPTMSALGAGLTLSEKGRPSAAARAAVTVDPEASDDDAGVAIDVASDEHDPAIEGSRGDEPLDAARDRNGPNPSSDDLDHTGTIDADIVAIERAAAVERAAASARVAAGADVSFGEGDEGDEGDEGGEDVAVDDDGDMADHGAFTAGELRVDDFPALPADSQDSEPAPTTVSLEGALPMMTKSPTMPMPAPVRTSDEDVESVAAGFDDGEGERIASPRTATPRPGPATMEEPPPNIPTKGTVSQPAEPPEDLVPSAAASDEDSAEALGDDDAAGDRSGEPVREPAGALDDDGFDDDLEDALVARLGEPRATPEPRPVQVHIADELEDPNTARTRAIFLPSDLDAMQQMQAAGRATTRGPGTLDIAVTGEIGVDDVELLEARATALEEEARALRERALLLRTRRSGSPRPATMMSIDPSFANATSLPILGSMEVQALSSVDDPTAAVDVSRRTSQQSAAPPVAPPAEASAAAAAHFEVDVDEALEPADGVSLAEVQAALGDVGALSGEATQVGNLRDGRVTDLKNGHSGDSDVFESAGPAPARKPVPTRVKQHDMLLSDRPTAPMPGVRAAVAEADARSIVDDDDGFATSAVVPPAPAEIAPAARPSNLGGIGLVVEDPRARDRLKKHLTPRFRRLVEAPDAMSAAALPEVSDVEALVFVRPRPDEATREGIVQLCEGPMPPRILIISSDARFDEMPEVSLRLPLGQRASEVAQQVLDGLRTLGVETLEADP